MIKDEDIIIKHRNDRDVEIPALLKFVNIIKQGGIDSFIDIGAHYSYYYYAQQLKDILPNAHYAAVDFKDDPETRKIVSDYIVGSVKTIQPAPTYDLVTCISTLEHCGVYAPKTDDYVAEQKSIVVQAYALAKKHVFFSFPFGKEGLYPNEYANITSDVLDFIALTAVVRGFHPQAAFYYTEGATTGEPWKNIDYKTACEVPLNKEKGVQCVCIFTASKF